MLIESIKLFFINYVNFEGRTRRSHFWLAQLGLILMAIAVALVDSFITAGILGALFGVAILVPQISLMVRRLHDVGRSGLWILVGFIPVVGLLLLLFWSIAESRPGNQWGPPASMF